MLWVVVVTVPLFWFAIDIVATVRARAPRAVGAPDPPLEHDFTVLVPIYGAARYLENAQYLSEYGPRAVLCTTSGETEEFYTDLRRLADYYGLSIYISPHVPMTTSKKRRTGGTIRDRIVRDALNELGDRGELGKYVVCVDADTTTPQPLGALVAELRHSGADFASVRLVPQSAGPMLVQLQRFEYAQAMRMRTVLPWLLSGACHVGRADVFRAVMERHSLFFQGNDVEAGLLADQLGYVATHIPFPVDTEVPSSWNAWLRQRAAWAGGEFRLFITNGRYILRHPFLWLYGGGITILMVGLRWWTLESSTITFAAVIAVYYVYVTWAHWNRRNMWLLLMPFYLLFNSLIMVPVGLLWYFVMAVPERNFGIISPHRTPVGTPAAANGTSTARRYRRGLAGGLPDILEILALEELEDLEELAVQAHLASHASLAALRGLAGLTEALDPQRSAASG